MSNLIPPKHVQHFNLACLHSNGDMKTHCRVIRTTTFASTHGRSECRVVHVSKKNHLGQQYARPSFTYPHPHKTSLWWSPDEVAQQVLGKYTRRQQVNFLNRRPNPTKSSGCHEFSAAGTVLEDSINEARHHPKTTGDWLVVKSPPVDWKGQPRSDIYCDRPQLSLPPQRL
jgi:hypothetical protein